MSRDVAQCFVCRKRRKVIATVSVEVLGADFGSRYLCRSCVKEVFDWKDFQSGRDLY